jgi:phage gp29-like protein
VSRSSATEKSRQRKHIPVTAYKAPFTIYSNAFRTQEWYNLAREDVLRLRKTPPKGKAFWLISWLVQLQRVNASSNILVDLQI